MTSDVLTPEQRRFCMSNIRGRDTKPELRLRKACWHVGMRYTLGSKLPGRPDFVFPGKKIAVFVDGCFWHGCPLHYTAPKTRPDFWRMKIEGTIARDKRSDQQLKDAGWMVCRIWEHQIKHDLPSAVQEVMRTCSSRP